MKTDSEIFNYAIRNYYNPSCKTAEEFADDFNTTIKIKKLINRHLLGESINFRLLLNHFMTMYNVFNPNAATLILFMKMQPEHYSCIKTISVFLNYFPDNLSDYGICLDNVEFDKDIVEFLRGI